MVNWTKGFVYLFGVMFVLAGISSLTQSIGGFFGGLLLIVGGLLLIPPSRELIRGYLDGYYGFDFSEISTALIIVLALSTAFAGVALSPTQDSDPAAETPVVTQTPVPTSTPTQSAAVTPTTIASTATATSTPTESPTSSGPRTSWTVTVVDVIDGDTMDIRYPNGTVETIRLLGVDTPETSVGEVSPDEWDDIPDNTEGRDWLVNWGGEATSFAEQELSGEEVIIETDSESDRRGYYGRLLVYVYASESAETSFNKRLLDDGYARYYDSEFSKSSEYRGAAIQAQSNDIGVWGYDGSTSSGSSGGSGSSSGSIVVSSIHEDADGNDNENLNDEYVTFENTGSSDVDMSGWTVSDEADHVYYFPSGFTLDAGASVTLYTGSGSDSDSELYWGQESAVWNNGGDTVYLENSDGETVEEYSY